MMDDLELEGFRLILRHRRLERPNYCFEWSASQLKDAALLTLELALAANEDGNSTLHDATPYNIFFDFPEPVFFDIGSFAPTASSASYLWAPYDQFCRMFLFPLYLHSVASSEAALGLMRTNAGGLSQQTIASVLGLWDKFRLPGYIKRVSLAMLSMKLMKKMAWDRQMVAEASAALGGKVDMRAMRRKFFRSLRRDIDRIKLTVPDSNWTGYYDETQEDVLDRKLKAVSAALENLSPETVLDIGANTGEFSLMAARQGAKVVALDTDHSCVDSLYRRSRNEGLSVLPLVMNILDPSPGFGWRGIEYPPATERFSSDIVLALALIHHLVFTGGQDFGRIIKSIGDYQKGSLIIEYVDISDPMTAPLPRRPGIDYSWYTEENFLFTLRANYKEVRLIEKLSPSRSLYVCSGFIA